MRDLFLVHHHQDQDFAKGLADSLAGRGLTLWRPAEVWPPGVRLLKIVDGGLSEARYALVVVSGDFLKVSWPRKELDGLTTRRNVVALLHGVEERDVAVHSRRLAIAAISGSMMEHLVRLLRNESHGNGVA
jgi:TIR domain-containing protein